MIIHTFASIENFAIVSKTDFNGDMGIKKLQTTKLLLFTIHINIILHVLNI